MSLEINDLEDMKKNGSYVIGSILKLPEQHLSKTSSSGENGLLL